MYCHDDFTSCPSIWATLSALLINILLGSFQLLHSDQPLSEGEIILFSGVCQSGGAALSTPEAVVASRTDWQTADATDDDQRQHHHRASFSARHQLTPSCILHRAQQHHADASACQQLPRSPASVLWHFCRAKYRPCHRREWLTAHDRQTMMVITRAWDAPRWLCSYINLLTTARFFEFCNQAVSLMLELTTTSAR